MILGGDSLAANPGYLFAERRCQINDAGVIQMTSRRGVPGLTTTASPGAGRWGVLNGLGSEPAAKAVRQAEACRAGDGSRPNSWPNWAKTLRTFSICSGVCAALTLERSS